MMGDVDVTLVQSATEELWRHPDPSSTPMWQFLEAVNKKHNLDLHDYPDLYQWSIENVEQFWEQVWGFVGITASVQFDEVGEGLC